MKQSNPDWDLRVEPVQIVGVHIDRERGIGLAQELKQGAHHIGAGEFLKLSGRGRERRRNNAEEREGGGNRDVADAELAKRQVDVPDRRKEMIDGLWRDIDEVVADGDGGDVDARVEGDDVDVEPVDGVGAIGGYRGDQMIGDGEENGDIGVQEGSNDIWVRILEAERVEVEGMNGGGNVVRRGCVGVIGGGRRVGDADAWEGGDCWEKREMVQRESEGDGYENAGKHGGSGSVLSSCGGIWLRGRRRRRLVTILAGSLVSV